ncbi:MAG: hypothetical protein ACK4TR_16530 [Phenylobacterium sp.]|uniref:hypothetical protein n=1 Tax=Phenylobacterium sp. TaxID=1871053 RepID=UPI0039199334
MLAVAVAVKAPSLQYGSDRAGRRGFLLPPLVPRGGPPGRVETRGNAGADSLDAAERALAGAVRLLEQYEDPERPYLSRTAPQFVHDHAGDYGHLARVFEWSTGGEEGEE